MSKLQKEAAAHVDMKKGVWLHAYRLPNEYSGLSEEFDYQLEIHGYNFPLTEAQFDSMHQARIQVWDDGAKAEQERIIKLLENEKFILPEGIDEGLTLMPIQEAIALIKRQQK